MIWCAVGIYQSAISALLETSLSSQGFKSSFISKLKCPFYLQHLTLSKCFGAVLFLLEIWYPVFSLIFNFFGRWLLLVVVTAELSDLTLFHTDKQHLFLQGHTPIFVLTSGGKMDDLSHLPLQINIESHSNVNLCPVFYLKGLFKA